MKHLLTRRDPAVGAIQQRSPNECDHHLAETTIDDAFRTGGLVCTNAVHACTLGPSRPCNKINPAAQACSSPMHRFDWFVDVVQNTTIEHTSANELVECVDEQSVRLALRHWVGDISEWLEPARHVLVNEHGTGSAANGCGSRVLWRLNRPRYTWKGPGMGG